MKHEDLATYIHDHLAGAQAALELIAARRDDCGDNVTAAFLSELHTQISEERRQLVELAEHFPLPSAAPRRAAAWLAEKALEAKLALDGDADGAFRLFESLELVSLGIAGKRLLWRLLARAADADTQLVGPDYAGLVTRSVQQRRNLEPFRLRAAAQAFGRD